MDNEYCRQTYSGGTFSFSDPQPEQVRPIDIAHQLSLITRFTGATTRFYSVAEHSIRCSYIAPQEYKLQALLHDAPEAYYGDINRPLKNWLRDNFGVDFSKIDEVVYKALGVNPKIYDVVHEIDSRMLMTERRALLKPAEDPDLWWSGLPEPYDKTSWFDNSRWRYNIEDLFMETWLNLCPSIDFELAKHI